MDPSHRAHLVVPPLSFTGRREAIAPDEVLASIGVDDYKQRIAYRNAILLLLREQRLQTNVCECHSSNTPPQNLYPITQGKYPITGFGHRHPVTNDYVLSVPSDPFQGNRLRTSTTLYGST